MNDINEILKQLLEKKCSIEEAEKLLRANLIEEVGDVAKLDIFRKTRTGIKKYRRMNPIFFIILSILSLPVIFAKIMDKANPINIHGIVYRPDIYGNISFNISIIKFYS